MGNASPEQETILNRASFHSPGGGDAVGDETLSVFLRLHTPSVLKSRLQPDTLLFQPGLSSKLSTVCISM